MAETITMSANGDLVVSMALRRALGMQSGGKIVAHLEDGALVLVPLHEAIRRAQSRVRQYVPEGTDLSGELIQDRRREAIEESAPRRPGLAKGVLTDAFFAPPPDDELDAWDQ